MFFTIKEALKRFKYHKRLTTATLITSVITYFTFGIFLLLSITLLMNFNSFEKKESNIIAFVSPEASDSSINLIKEKVKNLEGVTNVQFISNSSVLKDLQKDFENEQLPDDIAEQVSLPHTLIVNFEKITFAEKAAPVIDNMKDIEEVRYKEQYLIEINNAINGISNGVFLIILGLLFSSTLFIVITISLSIYQQRQNIEIMILTGVPIKHIVNTFVVQGLFISIPSSLISAYLTIYMYREYFGIIKQFLIFLNTPELEQVYTIIPIAIVCLGTFIGGIGSFISSKFEINKIIK